MVRLKVVATCASATHGGFPTRLHLELFGREDSFCAEHGDESVCWNVGAVHGDVVVSGRCPRVAVSRAHALLDSLAAAHAHSPPGMASPEVEAPEVVHVGRMYGPVAALAPLAASLLHEALVQRQVVADAVAPARRLRVAIIGEFALYPLVDVGEDELPGRALEDRQRDERDVR